jgi:hypothetical protein
MTMRGWALAFVVTGGAVVFIACVGDASNPVGTDAGVDAGIDALADTSKPPDAAVDAGAPCDPTKPFGVPTAVPGLKGQTVWLTSDEKTAYTTMFLSDGGAGAIYVIETTSRATTADPFGAAVVSEVNTLPNNDGHSATLTGDGKTIMFHSYRSPSLGNQDLFVSTRSSPQATFPTPAPLANVNSASTDADPVLSPDGLDLYFASNRAGSAYDVFHAVAGSQGSFGAPVKVDLGTGDAQAPLISPDGLGLYFSTSRGGGKNDIWVATRSTTKDGFGTPAPVAELNTSGSDDFADWLSPDQCRIYITRVSGGVFVAARP